MSSLQMENQNTDEKTPFNAADQVNEYEMDHELNLNVDDSNLIQKTSFLAQCLDIMCCPFTCLCGVFCLEPNEEAVITNFGTYTGKYTEPGIHYKSCWGRELHKISVRQRTIELPDIKVIDKSGNPLDVSAVVIYRFIRSEVVALSLENGQNYVYTVAQSTLRKVVSHFCYEVDEDSNEPTLKSNASLVSKKLCDSLSQQLRGVGVEVIAFQLNEISYAPEIASAMLKRQQAEALVQARRTLVNGCTLIAIDAVNSLEKQGINMDDKDKIRIVSNLLTVTCSDSQTVNNIPVGTE